MHKPLAFLLLATALPPQEPARVRALLARCEASAAPMVGTRWERRARR